MNVLALAPLGDVPNGDLQRQADACGCVYATVRATHSPHLFQIMRFFYGDAYQPEMYVLRHRSCLHPSLDVPR
jgi:hypothetical protein